MGIGSAFGDITGGLINVADPGRSGKRYAQKAYDLWSGLPLPEYEDRDLLGPRLSSAGDITAETYDPVLGDMAQISEDPALREMQLLQMMNAAQRGEEGLTLQDRVLAERAQGEQAREFGRADQAILSNMARRGRGGGGTELMARLASSGDQADLARAQGTDLAMLAVQNRIQGQQAAAGMAGATRGQDFAANQANAALAERYQEFISNMNTQAARDAMASKQQAADLNLQRRQRIADENVLQGYGARTRAQDRRDAIAGGMFEAGVMKTGGQTGALGLLGRYANRKQQAKQKRVQEISGAAGNVVDAAGATYFGLPSSPGGGDYASLFGG